MNNKIFSTRIVMILAALLLGCDVLPMPPGSATTTPTKVTAPPLVEWNCLGSTEGRHYGLMAGAGITETLPNGTQVRIDCVDENGKYVTTISAPVKVNAPSVVASAPTVRTAPSVAVAPGNTNCKDVKILRTPPSFRYKKNSDTGDPWNWYIVWAQDVNDPKVIFIALGEPKSSLDFERPEFRGSDNYFEAKTDEAAKCLADEAVAQIKANQGLDPYKLYVGKKNAPSGWSKSFPSDWKMYTWFYKSDPIDAGAPGTQLPPINAGSGVRTFFDPSAPMRLEVWYTDTHEAWHPFVYPGYELKIPDAVQGSGFKVVGGDIKKYISRWFQAAGDVYLRDSEDGTKPMLVHMRWCGPASEAPTDRATGFPQVDVRTSFPDGWSCTKK